MIKSEAEKLLEETLLELDVFNASILGVLVGKKICTLDEFKKIQDAYRPVVIKQGKIKRQEMKEAMKQDEKNNPINKMFDLLKEAGSKN